MNGRGDTGTPTDCRSRRLVDFLLSPKAGTLLPGVFLAALLLTPLSRTAMTFLLPPGWQISGYYLGGLFYGLVLLLGGAWLVSVIMLFARREVKRGVGRLLAILAVLLAGGMIAAISMLFLLSTISGWPIDSVYSPSRGKYYILAYEPIPTDTVYRVFSVAGTRLNPVWKVEFSGTILDYSEDHSLTENPHLLLSKDEQLLVIGRGGQLTDALLIDSRQSLTQFVPWADADREVQWRQRTERIRFLLAEHASPATQPSERMTDSEVKAVLKSWCVHMAEHLTQALSSEGWDVSCQIEEIEPANSGLLRVWFAIECKRDSVSHSFVHHMSLVQDGRRLLITEQDRGLSWSGEEERVLAERVQSALLQFAADGTYVGQP